MEKLVKENKDKMNDVARNFIEIAVNALQKAVWAQTNGYQSKKYTDLVKRMMEVTQSVGDLSREG